MAGKVILVQVSTNKDPASGIMRSMKESNVLKLSCLNRKHNHIRPGMPLLEKEGRRWEHSRS